LRRQFTPPTDPQAGARVAGLLDMGNCVLHHDDRHAVTGLGAVAAWVLLFLRSSSALRSSRDRIPSPARRPEQSADPSRSTRPGRPCRVLREHSARARCASCWYRPAHWAEHRAELPWRHLGASSRVDDARDRRRRSVARAPRRFLRCGWSFFQRADVAWLTTYRSRGQVCKRIDYRARLGGRVAVRGMGSRQAIRR
jgi:hypothetical protein